MKLYNVKHNYTLELGLIVKFPSWFFFNVTVQFIKQKVTRVWFDL